MMNKNMNNNYFLIACLFLMVTSCKPTPRGERIVSVSILPQKYFVERIAGDIVSVNVMIPPGMNPATCDLRTEQLRKLYDSQIYFAIGYLPFETIHLYPVLKQRDSTVLINHSERVFLLDGTCGHIDVEHEHEQTHEYEHGQIHEQTHEQGHEREQGHEHKHKHEHDYGNEHGSEKNHRLGVDPHIWLSPDYAQSICMEIFAALSSAYPEREAFFQTNYETLSRDIEVIKQRLQLAVTASAQKAFLIYHPALTYFANDFGLEQISVENDGKEPGPTYLADIIGQVKTKGIRVIFIQKQFDVRNAAMIAKVTGCKLIQIDPLNENWMAEMERMVEILEHEFN
ncbi:cation ABC transporter substrate-binding protein [Bacteroidia bacterium]|nr:cation ABC transporter substrate-binding protein [Bacteroidia bacterium]